jgi:hypothetical protein
MSPWRLSQSSSDYLKKRTKCLSSGGTFRGSRAEPPRSAPHGVIHDCEHVESRTRVRCSSYKPAEASASPKRSSQ